MAGNVGSKFYWVTNKGAPKHKIVTMDVAAANPVAADLVPEDTATLEGAAIVGGKLVASYLVDAKTEVRRYDVFMPHPTAVQVGLDRPFQLVDERVDLGVGSGPVEVARGIIRVTVQ